MQNISSNERFRKFMDEYLPTVQQKIDGLVLHPVNEPIRLGTHETMFKWKPQEQNTVDFLMKREKSREVPGATNGPYGMETLRTREGEVIF